MRALHVLIPTLAIMVIAYRYYSAFIAARVLALDDSRVTPAHRMYDGRNYYPTSRWVLFGHHFAAISGAGPLVGPVLALQFGFAPGLLWLVAGVCLAGAVHDFTALWASTRRGGLSLAEIARSEIGTVAGATAGLAILFMIIVAMAGMGLAVVNALAETAWGAFTIAMTMPLALLMGFYMVKWRPGRIREATTFGVIGMIFCVVAGEWVAGSSWGAAFVLTRQQLVIAVAVYGFAASVLPVWMLLTPRDYLSSFMKLGTIGALIVGVIVVNPELRAPSLSSFATGGGPIIPGPLFPFVFITIACGAVSGFHALVGSGTTPKMLDKESDMRPIGYGAMLCESLVGVMALVTAASLEPADYYAINTPPAVFETLGLSTVHLAELERQVGEVVTGRPGGAVSLAVGIADIFSGLPGMRGLMAYWYHFAIMFEALFILTTIDSGTRIGRFLVQELGGRVYKPFGRAGSMPASIVATAIVVFGWSYFLWTGDISTIWPMFGIANQLIGSVALSVVTTILINMGRAKYAWITLVPLCFLAVTTLTAGYLSVRDTFWPMAVGANPALVVRGYVNAICTSILMACVVIILVSAARRWIQVLSGRGPAGESGEA
jgi:carbon starvation protein